MVDLYGYFPVSSNVCPGNIGSLVVSLAIYLVACAVLGLVQFILGWIPIVGVLIRIVFGAIGIYCTVGIVLSVLRFIRV